MGNFLSLFFPSFFGYYADKPDIDLSLFFPLEVVFVLINLLGVSLIYHVTCEAVYSNFYSC